MHSNPNSTYRSAPRAALWGVLALTSLSLTACGVFSSESFTPPSVDIDADTSPDQPPGSTTLGPNGLPLLGARVGDSCTTSSACRMGLTCEPTGTCAPEGRAPQGEMCTLTAECAQGLTCGLSARCEPAGGGELGEQCTSPIACGRGLRCNLSGFTGYCEPEGSADAGQTCETSADCYAPLGCSGDGVCQLLAFGGLAFMPDATCPAVDPSADFRAYFRIPRDEPLRAFYELPFPNDARIQGGRLNMDGHHNPGLRFIGGEIVDAYLTAVSDTFEGFSTNPTVFFRFTRALDFSTLVGQGDAATLRFINVDSESDNYGRGTSMFWTVTTGRGKFICDNYLAVHPAWSAPLEYNTTYAVILTDGLRGNDGALPRQDDDLTAVLASTRPADSFLGEAWDAYAPLRAYIQAEPTLDRTNVIGATVFTTMNPSADMPGLRAAVRAQPTPELDNLTLCEPGATSPCADGSDRACLTADGQFIQLHATYSAPIWQRGTRPYLTEADGGDLAFSGQTPVPQGTEDICLSMTIPTGEMPEDGWPVVMYAHGTGGSFLSHIREGVARRLSRINLPDDRSVRVASVSIDGVQHGPRRGDTDLEPEPLFFNFVNPRSARGNTQQGAADYFYLTYLLENVDIPAGASPTGDAIRFNADQIFFFGHSQGSQVGAPFAAFERGLRGVIFSGAGGSLPLSLLNKTEPVDIASAVRFVLRNGNVDDNNVSELDPLLSLLQMHIDPVDPLNYARLYFRETSEDAPPMNVFMSYGYNDNYTPEPNQRAFAGAMAIPTPSQRIGTLSGLPESDYPISANRGSGDSRATAIVIPAQPGAFDGHFVIFRDESLSAQLYEFIGTAILDEHPTVSAP